MKGTIPPLPSMKRGNISGLNSTVSSTSGSSTLEEESHKENYVPSTTATENKRVLDQNRIVSIPPLKRHNTKISSISNISSFIVHSSTLDVSKRSRLKESSPKQIPTRGTNATPSLSDTLTNSSPTLNSHQESRVLRFGETIESFFCLPSTLTCPFSFRHEGEEVIVNWLSHYELCQEIVQNLNGSANDINKWSQVVNVAFNYVQNKCTEQNPLGKEFARRELI